MYFKKLVGKRCYLSPINPGDYEKYTAWVNDMEVALGTSFASSLITAIEEREILEKLSKSEYNFAIVDMEKDEPIGNVGFNNISYRERRAEIGIFIGNKEFWGKGYATEAMELLLDFGFNILNLHNIHLKVYSFNKPAISCYKKLGFKEAGRFREVKQIAGQKYDELLMDMLATEFNSIYIRDLVEKKIQ